METILGPFHPHLENAVVDEILRHKKSDLLSPLLILVPSDALRRRLKVLLAGERHLNLLNVYIFTFHQLSLRLFEELHGERNPELKDDGFLEETLRQLIRMGGPGTLAFSGIEERLSGCAALWQTLRDLKDGMVDPARGLEALKEGHFGHESRDKISDLFLLLDTFVSNCKRWGIRDYSDLDILVMEQAASSQFLRQFRRIFYYGFYDLTQIQLDLFQTVARHYATTLLFPIVHKHPAWDFAERFYERYIQGLSTTEQVRNQAANSAPASVPPPILSLFVDGAAEKNGSHSENFRCVVLSCSGACDEVLTVAKEILRLVSDEGIAFHEIGVVARSLEPYLSWIKEIFTEHRIPMTTLAEETLVQFPLAKAVLLLTHLSSKDYLRSHFIDLVSAPFFNIGLFCRDGSTPRPDLWDILTRRLGITKGIEEWRRLERFLSRELILAESKDEDENGRLVTISAEQVRILWDLLNELQRDLACLPAEASWSQYVSSWKTLLQKYLGIAEGGKTLDLSREEQVREAILNTLEGLAGLDTINPKISLDTFVQTYQRWLERSFVPLTDWNANGVAVLDPMGARAIPFRVLFILGLNEGMFPRTIREDAFLRDRHRRILETVLGYKVSEKLAAFDEEKLLFTLLVGAARERLYCLYQRSDETGRALAPSWYLSELQRALGEEEDKPALQDRSIPRGIVEKKEVEPFDRNNLLLPEELAVRLSLDSQDPTALVELCLPSAPLYKHGRQAMKSLEVPSGQLTEYDGILGSLSEYWHGLREHGISPTALEVYARCPFQFFARNILALERLERPEEMTALGPSDVGELLHLILKSFYQQLIDQGYFVRKGSSLDVRTSLKALVQKAFSNYELAKPVGFPLVWEILQEALTELLAQVIEQDLEELSQSGYRPVALEIEIKDQPKGKWPVPLKGLMIRGRMDRIDHQPEQNRYRVIDYKFKSGRNPSPEDKDLCRSALRGQRLQPPLYLLLGKSFVAFRETKAAEPTVEAAFYFLAPNWQEGPLVTELFPVDAWDGEIGGGLKETLSFLVEEIRQGRFFIHPGSYCSHCEVSELCRKNHLPTYWRAENDPLTKPHRYLRKKNPPKESADIGKRREE